MCRRRSPASANTFVTWLAPRTSEMTAVTAPIILSGVSSSFVIGCTLFPGPIRGLRPPQAGRGERLLVSGLLPQRPVHQFLDELDALELEKLCALVLPAIERHPNLPRPRKHLRVLDRDLVVEHVRAHGREPLDDVQRLAVEVARAVEPCLVVEPRHVDDERVPFPAPADCPIHVSTGGGSTFPILITRLALAY